MQFTLYPLKHPVKWLAVYYRGVRSAPLISEHFHSSSLQKKPATWAHSSFPIPPSPWQPTVINGCPYCGHFKWMRFYIKWPFAMSCSLGFSGLTRVAVFRSMRSFLGTRLCGQITFCFCIHQWTDRDWCCYKHPCAGFCVATRFRSSWISSWGSPWLGHLISLCLTH